MPRRGIGQSAGRAKKELSQYEMEHSDGLIREAVTAVLANFPLK
jgi:hypothetical protein